MNPESGREQEIQTHSADEGLGLERIVFFSDAVMATGLSMGALWWYASHRHSLIDERLNEQFIRARSIALAVPLFFLVSIPVTFVSRTLAVALWCTLPLVTFAVLKLSQEKQRESRAAPEIEGGETQ